MKWILENKETIIYVLGALYGLATVISGLTRTKADDEILGKIGKVAAAVGLDLRGKNAPKTNKFTARG